MGVIGQLPHAPDELPGREVTTGEPPAPPGSRADELPSLTAAATSVTSVSVSLADYLAARPDADASTPEPEPAE